MRHRKKQNVLRSRRQGALVLRTMTNQLLQQGSLTTSLAKGKLVQRKAERLIRLSATNSLASRRQLLRLTNDRELTDRLLKDIGPKYLPRRGGYTSLIKIGQRRGDGSTVATLTLVDQS